MIPNNIFINNILNKQRGFTLIELLVVIGILVTLVIGVTNNIVTFQKDAKLDSTANEFASTLETAHNKSVSGEVPDNGVNFSNYENNDTLPLWSVGVDEDNYQLMCKYKKESDSDYTKEVIENNNLLENISIIPTNEISFERLTGKRLSSDTSFTVSYGDYGESRTVNVDENGNVTIIK